MSYSFAKPDALVEERKEKIVQLMAATKDFPCDLSSIGLDIFFVRYYGCFPEKLFVDCRESFTSLSREDAICIEKAHQKSKSFYTVAKIIKQKKMNKSVKMNSSFSSAPALYR